MPDVVRLNGMWSITLVYSGNGVYCQHLFDIIRDMESREIEGRQRSLGGQDIAIGVRSEDSLSAWVVEVPTLQAA